MELEQTLSQAPIFALLQVAVTSPGQGHEKQGWKGLQNTHLLEFPQESAGRFGGRRGRGQGGTRNLPLPSSPPAELAALSGGRGLLPPAGFVVLVPVG